MGEKIKKFLRARWRLLAIYTVLFWVGFALGLYIYWANYIRPLYSL